MAINCPICGESFKDGRGLHGHLRFKEDLSGEELEETFQQAKDQSASKEGEDPVLQHVKRVALHHVITPLKDIKNIRPTGKMGSPWTDLDLEGGGLFGGSGEKEVAEQVLSELEERLENEKEQAGKELNSVLRKEIKQRA